MTTLTPEHLENLRNFFSALAKICGMTANQSALPYIEAVIREEAPMRAHMREAILEMEAILQRTSPPEELAAMKKH